jgi:hypothetical protein
LTVIIIQSQPFLRCKSCSLRVHQNEVTGRAAY